MIDLARLRRALLERTPGTALNIAMRKRRLQRELQDSGMSRAAAIAEVSRRFRGRS